MKFLCKRETSKESRVEDKKREKKGNLLIAPLNSL